jgi:hypothetical protein
MNHCEVLAWVADGEIWCTDCCEPEDDDETVHPIFAGDEREEGDTLYCRGCDSYFDEDWGGWLLRDKDAIERLREAING